MVDVNVLVAVPTAGGASPVDMVPWVVAGAKQPDGGQVTNSILLLFFPREKNVNVFVSMPPSARHRPSIVSGMFNEFLR